MKCIGRKYDGFILYFILMIVLGLLSLASLIIVIIMGEVRGITLIIPLLFALGTGIWIGYYLFYLPYKLVFYDEELRNVKIYLSRKNYKIINLDDIKKINLESPFTRTPWLTFDIELKNGEKLSVGGISKENEIIDSLMVLK